MDKKLTNLDDQRNNAVNQLTEIYNTLTKMKSVDYDKNVASTYTKELLPIHGSFWTIQGKIRQIEALIEEQFIADWNECLDICTKMVEQPNETPKAANAETKLPPSVAATQKVSIKPFDGNYEEWQTFHDAFTANVVNMTTLEKFAYLKSVLSGQAARSIMHLKSDANDYAVAWKLLRAHYCKPRLVIQQRIVPLLNLTKISDTLGALPAFATMVEEKLDRLKDVKESVLWQELLLYVVTRALPDNTVRDWEDYACDYDQPTIANLLTYLKSCVQGCVSYF